MTTKRAPGNRTLVCLGEEMERLSADILRVDVPVRAGDVEGRIICGDALEVAERLPGSFVDLLILDPPYNASKNYNGNLFRRREKADYGRWFRGVLEVLAPTLRPTATVYVCSDWKTSTVVAPVLEERFQVRNRITWEREKGRGSGLNWKNNMEDIWFCTVSDDYHFDVDSVKMRRRVLAPYRVDGKPKGWSEEKGGNYRLTHPSNIWTDITVPFWSMRENTDHPTQKPEKLVAKLVLASSRKGDLVFDPFAGSGTAAVVAKKLGRKFCAIELDRRYCCWALKRLGMADADSAIQGYADGVFRERNSAG